jgi:hypothetical protein
MIQQQGQQQGASPRARKGAREAALKVTVSKVLPPGALSHLPVIAVRVARADSVILAVETSYFQFREGAFHIVVEDETMGTCERQVIVLAVQYAIYLWAGEDSERTSYTVGLSAR